MGLLILLMVTAAAWEFVFWRLSARWCGPTLPAQWGMQLVLRSLLGLVAFAAFQTKTVAYAAVFVFHGEWAGWLPTLLVLSGFLAMISGAVFAALSLPFGLVWWWKGRRRVS